MNKKLIKMINRHKFISFDIFDTALIRNVSEPKYVFDIVEKNIMHNGEGFSKSRQVAEENVKTKLGKISPNIDEIYSGFYNDEIKKLEIDVEKKIIKVNKEIKEIYDYCVEKNKVIVFTSDMYLPSTILSELLVQNGYENFENVFSSCDYNKTKGDGGLYDEVVKKLKCKPSEILHIGDSLKGDFINAKRKNLHSFLYSRKKSSNKTNTLEEDILNEFIYNNDENNGTLYKLGYEKFGILLYAFCNWLNNNLKNLSIDKVFFLSRDGYIMKKAFDLVKDDNIESKYLYVSRRSLNVPNLWKNPDFENLGQNINMSNYFNIETFIRRLGLQPENYDNILNELEILKQEKYTNKSFYKNEKLKKFYEKIKDDVIKNSKEEYELLIKYFEQNEFRGKVAIVDIGWHGSMQKQILRACENANIDIDLTGFYMGQEKIVDKGNGFLFNEFDNPKHKIPIAGSFGMFESLFLAHHGSVRKYKIDKNAIEPVFEKYEFENEEKSLKIINDIQTGAVEFCEEFNKNNYLKKLDFRNTAFEPIRKVLVQPTMNDIKNLEDVIFNDTYNVKIIETRNLLYYIMHMKEFKEDFLKSVWKIGFIKKVFKLPFPYFKVYYYLKNKKRG